MKFNNESTLYSTTANKRNMKNLFLYLAYLSLAVISSYSSFFTFDVPFPAIIIFVGLIFCYSIGCMNKVIKFTYIPFFLLVRLLLFCINAVIIGVSTAAILEQIAITFCSIIVFLCGSNFLSEDKKEIKNILTVFSLITSIQILACIVVNPTRSKLEIIAGIGASNYAACFLLMCVSYLLFIKTDKFEKFVIVIDIAAILATQSFGAYFAFFIVMLIFLRKQVNWRNRKVRRNALIIIALMVIAVIVFFNTSIGRGAWEKIIEKLGLLFQGNWKRFGSSRLELFSFSWKNIKRHFLFGTIENFDASVLESNDLWRFQYERTHNTILESLLLYGLVGTILNGGILYYICKKGKKALQDDRRKFAFIVCFIAVNIHGMIEPAIFTLHFELFLWLMIGAFLSNNRRGMPNLLTAVR